jgi:hypothetical protein
MRASPRTLWSQKTYFKCVLIQRALASSWPTAAAILAAGQLICSGEQYSVLIWSNPSWEKSARRNEFRKLNQADLGCPDLQEKTSLFLKIRNCELLGCLASPRGAYASSRTLSAGCGGRKNVADERCYCGRRSRVVLTPRRWCQARGILSRATEARKPGLRGEPEVSRKTIAQGMPFVSAYLWRLTRVLFILHARLWVLWASGIPCALFRGRPVEKTRTCRVARRRSRVFSSLTIEY